ncbi:MAG TPA: AI-2E family transporter [Candidatus Limnocylindrales bacterium]|nr:AI-2E family transporter [Candidatus Limnocylindrales bacterium]
MTDDGDGVKPLTSSHPSQRAPDAGLVPGWVQGNTNLFATLVACVMVGLALFLIGWLAPVVASMGLGLFLAALAAPLFTWLEERGRSPALALTVTIGVVLGIGLGLVVLALAGATALTEGLVTYSAQLQSRYPDVTDPAVARSAAGALARILPPDVLSDALKAVVRIVVQVGQSLIFAVIVAALLLLDGQRLSRLVAGGIGREGPVFRETPGIARAAVTYFVVRIRINVVTALGLLVLMLILGIDDALLWAVAAFFLSFVPYLGLVLAMIPPAILAFAESGLLAATVFVVGGTALNLIAENVLEPTLTGRALSLSTWVVFTMFFFWVWLIGPVGALLSMPITVLVVLVLQHNERTQWIAALLSRQQPEDVAGLMPVTTASPRDDAAAE